MTFGGELVIGNNKFCNTVHAYDPADSDWRKIVK